MHIHHCRYNLIEGELRIDTANEQIVFVRHSLGEKEVYATWSIAEIQSYEVKSGLLTQEIVIVLKSSEILRFSANEIQPNIKDWIENKKIASQKKSTSKTSEEFAKKSKKQELPSRDRPKKKKSKLKTAQQKLQQSQKKDTNLKRTTQTNSFEQIKENLKQENTESQDDFSKSTILAQEEKNTSRDSNHDVQEIDSATESFNDIANIFREMKNDLTSNQSSFEDTTGTNITHKIKKSPSSLEEDDTEQKSCCSNWIVWLIVFLFLVECLGY